MGAQADMDDETVRALREEADSIKWHHSMDLGHGIVARGQDRSSRKLARLGLMESLVGKTVLDVGAWDGYFSFEAERRGAKRVLATDSYAWEEAYGHSGKRGFDLAKRMLGSKVEELKIDVMELAPGKIGSFDVVLFLGVLYHLKHPMLALEKVSSVTAGVCIVETAVDMLHCRRPALAFYPGSELGNDPSNWFGPNPPALVAMLKTVGFTRVEIVSGCRSAPFRAAKAAYYKYERGFRFLPMFRSDRVVVHAWK